MHTTHAFGHQRMGVAGLGTTARSENLVVTQH
jgi:hypothetical protein